MPERCKSMGQCVAVWPPSTPLVFRCSHALGVCTAMKSRGHVQSYNVLLLRAAGGAGQLLAFTGTMIAVWAPLTRITVSFSEMTAYGAVAAPAWGHASDKTNAKARIETAA